MTEQLLTFLDNPSLFPDSSKQPTTSVGCWYCTNTMTIECLLRPIWLLFFVLGVAAVVALILGEEQERKAWAAAAPTEHLYTTAEVCLHEDSGKVLNCGHCGECSNLHDIQIYHETRSTLTEVMTSCARGDLLFGKDAFECLKAEAGMTDGCTHCWVLNYKCNMENCVRTCVKHRFFSFLPSLNPWNSLPLDPCIACDEKLCGPIFVACAGANRRRVGVISDIERDMEREMCDKVDWNWILTREKESGDDDSKVYNELTETGPEAVDGKITDAPTTIDADEL